jgi:hypothetical protein
LKQENTERRSTEVGKSVFVGQLLWEEPRLGSMLLARRRLGQVQLPLQPCRCLCSSPSRKLEGLLGIDLKATTHEDIRAAYVQMALKTHPDHNAADDAAEQMAFLQRTWKAYLLSVRRSDGFTDFGIGCSFDDNEEEAAARAALVEQASRGVMNRPALSPSGLEQSLEKNGEPT